MFADIFAGLALHVHHVIPPGSHSWAPRSSLFDRRSQKGSGTCLRGHSLDMNPDGTNYKMQLRITMHYAKTGKNIMPDSEYFTDIKQCLQVFWVGLGEGAYDRTRVRNSGTDCGESDLSHRKRQKPNPYGLFLCKSKELGKCSHASGADQGEGMSQTFLHQHSQMSKTRLLGHNKREQNRNQVAE